MSARLPFYYGWLIAIAFVTQSTSPAGRSDAGEPLQLRHKPMHVTATGLRHTFQINDACSESIHHEQRRSVNQNIAPFSTRNARVQE